MNRDDDAQHARSACLAPRTVCRLVAWLILAAVLSAADSRPAAAQTSTAPEFTALRVGFQGAYKVGFWTPIELDIRGGGESVTGHVEIIVPDGDGVPTRFFSDPARPVLVLPGQQTTVRIDVKFGQSDFDLQARFVVEGQLAARREWETGYEEDDRYFLYPLEATDRLILNVGPSIGVASAIDADQDGGRHVIRVEEAGALPVRWYGYESVDHVVLATSDPAVYRPLLGNERASALIEWVNRGGRVLLSVGSRAPELLADSSPLAELAPGRFAGMDTLRQSASLEEYAGTAERVDPSGRAFPLEVPRLTGVDGRIEARDGDLPLVVRGAKGFGVVTFAAVELDQPPFRAWEGRSAMVARLFDLPENENEESDGGQVATVGYSDLVGDLRNALFDFQGVSFIPFWVVASLVFCYILIIGPLDYWLVKRVLRRMEATWVTFPIWVVLISVGAYLAAYYLKGRELRSNQAELVEMDLASGRVRGTTWTNIFSPRPDSYTLSLAPELPGETTSAEPEVLLSWLGVPGEGLSGMSHGGGASWSTRGYEFSPQLDRLSGVPIQVWSTKSITARWHAAPAEIPFEADLREDVNGAVEGTVTNRLGIDLGGARLFYGRWAYLISELEDGQRVRVGEQLRPVLSRTLLTRQRIQGEQTATTTYDAGTTDVPRIVEMMMFHELAGGRRYTDGLSNQYQDYLDMTRHLEMGRAILYVATRNTGSRLLRDDEPMVSPDDDRWTFYRLILPVEELPR